MLNFFKVIIPARYNSSRLPGKVLLDICGKPMIQHVWERAIELVDPDNVFIATDNPEVSRTGDSFGAQTILTGGYHKSGTERLLEVTDKLRLNDREIVVNMQADEPLLPPDLLFQVAENLRVIPEADVTTLYDRIISEEELNDPNNVKVVMDQKGFALYFSRSPIPHYRDGIKMGKGGAIGRKHIGLYGYRVNTLRKYSREFRPTFLESAEMLEQLRLLYHGMRIHVDLTLETPDMMGVDTQEDLDQVRLFMGLQNQNK